ncbi:regulation of nuclear pre-mRNA domain-containing protein 1B-like [Planoprotostelium fungivorum]|uniref:Regulation of nuclear pre-mRNA domain-containing protein 1B-like n=1 Tax=Planoprotostelium fungivorum TaxID=1890364 RepID=A0A2P6N9A7_9EUKA|nr:regulation of nuclear pre-mRNA domain-containing protein 1B-like [Planoprotostelium fungivorum]
MSFSEAALQEKLNKLNATQENIETLSQWILFYRKHYQQTVKLWYQQFQKGNAQKRLTLLYLSNDILQTSRKKGLEFVQEFSKVLPSACSSVLKDATMKDIHNNVNRMLNIWQERKVYTPVFIQSIKNGAPTPAPSTKEEKADKNAANGIPANADSIFHHMMSLESKLTQASSLTLEQSTKVKTHALVGPTGELQLQNAPIDKLEELKRILEEQKTRIETESNHRVTMLLKLREWMQTQDTISAHKLFELNRCQTMIHQIQSYTASLPPPRDPRAIVEPTQPLFTLPVMPNQSLLPNLTGNTDYQQPHINPTPDDEPYDPASVDVDYTVDASEENKKRKLEELLNLTQGYIANKPFY